MCGSLQTLLKSAYYGTISAKKRVRLGITNRSVGQSRPRPYFLDAYGFAAQFFGFPTSKFLKEYWRSIGEEKKSLAAVLSEIEPKKRSFSIKKEEDFDFFLGAYPN